MSSWVDREAHVEAAHRILTNAHQRDSLPEQRESLAAIAHALVAQAMADELRDRARWDQERP